MFYFSGGLTFFLAQVGDVTYVELFNDESDKPRGCGILEFATEELAKQAVEKMHRHELRGRKLVVKEDFDSERDKSVVTPDALWKISFYIIRVKEK